jgi:hypothetical protein
MLPASQAGGEIERKEGDKSSNASRSPYDGVSESRALGFGG